MKLSLIVPAFNEEKIIGECLAAAQAAWAAALPAGDELELLVVNNNSTDATADKAAAAGARVVFEPINGIARARNAGAQAASGDWFCFLDADSFLPPELAADVAALFARDDVAGGGVTVRMDELPLWAYPPLWTWNTISRVCEWAAGSFIFCRAGLFREIGGFDAHLYVSEELGFSKRLKRAARKRGLKFVILHRHPLLTSGRKARLYGFRGFIRTFGRLAWNPRRGPRSRADCGMWYDGRR